MYVYCKKVTHDYIYQLSNIFEVIHYYQSYMVKYYQRNIVNKNGSRKAKLHINGF